MLTRTVVETSRRKRILGDMLLFFSLLSGFDDCLVRNSHCCFLKSASSHESK